MNTCQKWCVVPRRFSTAHAPSHIKPEPGLSTIQREEFKRLRKILAKSACGAHLDAAAALPLTVLVKLKAQPTSSYRRPASEYRLIYKIWSELTAPPKRANDFDSI